MLRVFVRVSGALGLATVVLAMAASALAGSAARPSASQMSGTESQPQAASSAPNFTVALSVVVPNGLTNPVGIVNAGDGSGRLFVVEQRGYIRVIKNGALLGSPYLTLANQVVCCGERGLLGLAFDPDFKTNGAFYVNYTTNASGFSGDTVVARYQVANPSADAANVLTVTNIITIDQPESNHNGGDLHFGPFDNYLYIGMGDGGGAGDQHGTIGNGQNPAVLLGKILRLYVRGVTTYTIPASNPFTQTAGYRPEIWALGLRNPWRFSFDRGTGDLYIGDVGQDCFEEINYQPAASPGGENYGWRVMEGFHQFDPANMSNCNQPVITPAGLTLPVAEYQHPLGESVSGGYVYRGQAYPWLNGWYFYGDYVTGLLWVIKQTQPGVWSGAQKLSSGLLISSFGEDEQGELYVASYSQGAIYKIASTSPIDFSSSTKQASANTALTGDVLTYTIVVRNTGGLVTNTVRVTDTVPAGLSYLPGSWQATSGTPDPESAPTLKWNGVMSLTSVVTLTFAVSVTTPNTTVIVNTAAINPGFGVPFTRTAVIIVKPYESFLPVILRNN